jgi:hypothetical protein
MRSSRKISPISSVLVFGLLMALNESGFAAQPPSTSSQDEYLSCFQKTLGIVNAEREDHAPTLFSGTSLVVLLPAVREKKKGFYLFTQHSAYFQPVARPGAYYILNRAGHPALKFSVEKDSSSQHSREDYQVTQYPTNKIGVPYSKISQKNVFDISAHAFLSRELQKRMEFFATDLGDLEGETKRLKSSRSFAKGRLDNIDSALKECELVKKDKPLHAKIKIARKKLDQVRAGK